MFVPSNVSMKQVTKIPESDLSLFFSNGFSENMRNIIQTSIQKLKKKETQKESHDELLTRTAVLEHLCSKL